VSNPLSDAWGDFLAPFPWDWFVTLTFADEVKSFTGRNRCNAWLKSLGKAAGQPIFWFLGEELGDRSGRFHIHLLIGNVAHLHRFTWIKRWEVRNGWARIFEFDPSLGAAYYVAKYVTKQFGEWDLSDNLNAFRIQQPVLPLTGQRGSNRDSSMPIDSKPVQRRPIGLGHQLPISDFTEPDLAELAIDPVLVSFRDQTMRRR
jgi:hypothetical protein